MLMKTINELIMDSLEERLKKLNAAAKALVEQVENYTMRAGSGGELRDAKEKLKAVLRE